MQWTSAGDESLLTDESTFKITIQDVRNALMSLFYVKSNSEEFNEVNARFVFRNSFQPNSMAITMVFC